MNHRMTISVAAITAGAAAIAAMELARNYRAMWRLLAEQQRRMNAMKDTTDYLTKQYLKTNPVSRLVEG
jgi:hypothetical protein